MSATSSPVTPEHFEYLASRTHGDDAFLEELKREALAAGIPPIWISPEQASLMQVLLKLCRAREVVEVGTLAGYSALWMARSSLSSSCSGSVHQSVDQMRCSSQPRSRRTDSRRRSRSRAVRARW